jgi:predicted ATPase
VLQYGNAVESITSSPERHVEELLTLSIEHGFPIFLGWATLRGWSLTALGRAQEGLSQLKEGLSMVRATGTVAATPGILTGLAEAYAMLGQPVEGLKCLTEAAQIIEATEERISEAALHRVRGELFDATGNQTAAEQSYHQALTVAARQSAKVFELSAATSLARLWREQGKRTEARDLLAPIYDWFTEGFDTPVLKEAKALLEQLKP